MLQFSKLIKNSSSQHVIISLSLQKKYNCAKKKQLLDIFIILRRYEKLIKPVSTFVQEYQFLKEILLRSDSPVVFCHNDLLLTNILHDQEKNKVTFIDFEYAGYNYQAFDIANHFAEFAGMQLFLVLQDI